MKTLIIKLSMLTILLSLFSCKKEVTVDYKFSDRAEISNCISSNVLLKEAFYSFEEDLLNQYDMENRNLIKSYNFFFRNALSNNVPFETMVSEHTKAIFETLKNDSDLWNLESPVSKLNYNSDAMDCIKNNINNENLKKTLNALISTNSMKPKTFGATLQSQSRSASTDKHLSLYLALEYYYAKLFDVNFSQKEIETNNNKQTNNTPSKEEKDPHAGHNH